MNDKDEGARKTQILDIVRRSLGYIDERLVEHGERVAYIAYKTASMDEYLGVDGDKLLILCLLHDIGAYKTEEIDDMVSFETHSAMEHSVYGYAFINNTTALGDYADAILYHHTKYEDTLELDSPHKTLAALISLADRTDILLSSSADVNWESLRRLSGTVFSPALVMLLMAAEDKYDISGHIRDGSFKTEIEALLGDIGLTERDAESFLRMLVYSIDFRSPYTVTHTANTVAISETLAELLGLDARERLAVSQGAFLHDIGKIAVPYSILESPGRLTAEQMEVMKTHVRFSEEILRGTAPDEVCEIAVRHHEKLNGTGYHRGLGADELTLAQSIVAVADILSALISRRSYKEPFPKDKALSILKKMRDDGELSPRVCEAVFDNYDYIFEVINKTDDPVIEIYERIQAQYNELR